MSISLQLVAAIAACLAAVMSAVNIWLTGRREERSWRREATAEVLNDFLNASFRRPGTNALRQRAEGQDMGATTRVAEDAYTRQNIALTKLRLLTGAEVVEAAVQLYDIENYIQEVVLGPLPLPQPDDWDDLYRQRRLLRTQLINKSRSGLGLGPLAEIEEGRWRPAERLKPPAE